MADDDDHRGAFGSGPSAALLAAADPALREELRDYLKHQSELAQVQIEEARREDAIRHWGLRVRHVSDVLKLGLELAVAVIVLAVAVGLGAVIWQAAQADGLVIDSINVPAAMADKGFSGQVVANKLLDRLTVMQSQADSIRAPSTFTNDWTHDITVQIPDTGISLGQLVRFLNDWLGHQTHLTGELYETPAGAALTVRVGRGPGATFEDKAGNLDAIIAKAAEAVFADAQPYRYAVYVELNDHFAKAVALQTQLAATGTVEDRAWANLGLAILAEKRGDSARSRAFVAAGRAADPHLPNFAEVLGGLEGVAGHDEEQLRQVQAVSALIRAYSAKEWSPGVVPDALRSTASFEAQLKGDFRMALADTVVTPGQGGEETSSSNDGFAAIQMHDVSLARAYLANVEAARANSSVQNVAGVDAAGLAVSIFGEMQDWPDVKVAGAQGLAEAARVLAATGGWVDYAPGYRNSTMPLVAYAEARRGRFADADAILKTLPDDCDLCLRVRGKVDALRGRWRAAEAAFAAVAARSPDIPFAHTDWGQALLWKGDLDGAVAHFAKAHAIGPHFADPLEMWGEALIARNRSDLARAKFAEAGNYAPNWGRLHLKWGEALLWSGDRDGARKQFARASSLYLVPTERAELARMKAIHG